MICPYNDSKIKYVKQNMNNIDDSTNNITSTEEMLIQEHTPMKCYEEECGVWHDGKCNYNK